MDELGDSAFLESDFEDDESDDSDDDEEPESLSDEFDDAPVFFLP